MRVLYFGNGPRGKRCLEAVVEAGYSVAAVVAHSETSDVAEAAKGLGMSCCAPSKINDRSTVETLRGFSADLFVLAGYNQILRRELLNVPSLGVINLHGGKLPDYRGVAPINWQIINGEKEGGCAVLYADEGIDTGDIIEQATYPIDVNDTAGDLVAKQMGIFPPMLLRALEGIENGSSMSAPQDLNVGAYFTRRYPRDSRIDWRTMTAEQVHNLVRAMQGPGYPPAFCQYQDSEIEIHETRLLQEDVRGTPGRVALRRRGGLVAIARDRGLLIRRVARSGEQPVRASCLLRAGADFG